VTAGTPSKHSSLRAPIRYFVCLFLLSIPPVFQITAKYRARPYVPLPIESYPARLTSEGLAVAVEAMFTDALAATAFDKKDIVTSGIMPVAIIFSNSNTFDVEVEGSSVELLINKALEIYPHAQVTCIDFAENMIETARARLARYPLVK
jgi:hypothetical protein